MADFSIASQIRPMQLPDQLQQYAQFNQIAMQQAQMAKAQSDAEMQNKLRSLDRNSPEFLNQLYAMDPAKGMAFQKGMEDLAEAKRKRGEAAYDRGVTAKKEAALEEIFRGSVNNLAPPAPAASANSLVAPAVPQMSFGANVGEYTPAAAPAAPAAPAPAAAAPSPSSPDYASIINNLVKGGHIEEAKKIADLAKTSAEGQSKTTEAGVARMSAAYAPIQTLIQHVSTPADVEAYTRRIYSDPILGPEASRLKSVDQAVQDNLDLVNKVGLDQWKARNSNMDAKQLHDLVTTATAPKFEKVDRGGSFGFMDTNPKSPTYGQFLHEIQKTPVPKAPGEMETDTSKKVVRTITDDRGNVTGLNDRGEIVVTHKGMGAPSAARQKANMQAETMPKQLDYAISELENAIKPGGALEAATSSGAGALADTAAGFVGYATPGAIASAQLKPVQDIILKMVPRFEGPQSDRDVISYRQASGELANEKLPVKVRQAAAETIIRLMKTRKDQFITPDMASGEVPVQQTGADDISAADAILAKQGKK